MEYWFKFSLTDIEKIKKGKIDQDLLTKIKKMECQIDIQRFKEKEIIRKNRELWEIAIKEMKRQGFKDSEITKIKQSMQEMNSEVQIFNFLSDGQLKNLIGKLKELYR